MVTTAQRLEIEGNRRKIIEVLTELGGGQFTVDEGITYHEDKKNKQIALPQGMQPTTAAKALLARAQADKETVSVEKVFYCTPGDGAFCFQQALKDVLGIAGIGKPIMSMFGSTNPQTIEVRYGVGAEDVINVPWGRLDVPPLEGSMYLNMTPHPEYGPLFSVSCEVPKKYERAVNGLFKVVEQTIDEHSIYLGKAFQGVGLDIVQPTREFLDPYRVNWNEVVYADEVEQLLETEVWGVIRKADILQGAGQPINTKHLLYGPYGTGKTLAGALTAQVCDQEGWTFIQCSTGKDDIAQVIRWAKLYAKSNRGVVIFVEDIDVLIDTSDGEDKEKMSQMMDLFDGFDSKNNRVMMLMTSNRLDAFDAPFTRQGRFDNFIHVGALDREGVEKLLHALFRDDQLDPNLDFGRIYSAMEGYEPAFIRGTFNRVVRSSIVRTGLVNATLTTDDFVVAANAVRPQWEHHQAKKGEVKPPKSLDWKLRELFHDVATDVMRTHRVEVEDEGYIVTVDG